MEKHKLYDEVEMVVSKMEIISLTQLQKLFDIGINASSILFDQLESNKVIGPYDGRGYRTVLSPTSTSDKSPQK
jgi:DNA segregation ATPase FtsK/SpoIIIE-like protein